MTPPTLVDEGETTWTSSVSEKTAQVDVQADDVIVVFSMTESYNSVAEVVITHDGGAGMPLTPQQTIAVDSYCWAQISTAIADGTKTLTVTFTPDSAGTFGGNVLVFRGSDGVGTGTNKENAIDGGSGTEPSLAITTQGDNSTIVAACADWTANAGARTWRTVNGYTPTSGNGGEVTYANVTDTYTVFGAIWGDCGAAGGKAVGLSAPVSMRYSIVGIEVLGTGGGAVAVGSITPTVTL